MSFQQQDNQRMIELAKKWQDGSITGAEKLEFDQWYNSFVDEPVGEEADLKERIYRAIQAREKIGQRGRIRALKFRRLTAAAAALVLLLGAVWLYRGHSSRVVPGAGMGAVIGGRIVPGGNKAILTLANGETVTLDSAKNGLLARQGVIRVVKKMDGAVAYEPPVTGAAGQEGSPLFNTITTPRGGQYHVTLPDGSKVWLNAASSIRFPTAFTGSTREVDVRGEVFFEISADKSRPFLVSVNYPDGKGMQQVEVLGTQFNIMAYQDEQIIKTTLLEGSIRVGHRKGEGLVLHPGQQAQLGPDGALHSLDGADTEAAVAWKNGQTFFASEDIQAIMRKVSRWYDIDVEYRGEMPSRKFTGGIARSSDFPALLKILELNKIHYVVEGKKITLMP